MNKFITSWLIKSKPITWFYALQLTSAFYKSIRGGDDAKEELYKQLAALEKELKERNTKFIGGELFSIILIQIGLSILPVLPMLEETGNMTIWLIVWKIKKKLYNILLPSICEGQGFPVFMRFLH